MKLKKKVLFISLSVLVILLILVILNFNLSRQSDILVDNVYNSKGNYEILSSDLSKHDYNVIAAGSTGALDKDLEEDNYTWDFKINHIHTISWVFGAYTYVNDSCDLYNSDGTKYAGYSGRHIRLQWKLNIKTRQYEVVDVYEYITPGFINSFFDMIS